MTNQTPESVIAEIRHRRAYSVYGDGTAYLDIGRLLEALELVRAERDAALAAIERARVEVESINQAAQKSLCGSEPDHAGIYEGAERALAALDGAPEPEAVEWEERLAACDKHGTHCWSCTRHTERRRPAGEWHRLPAEGESK